MTNKLPWELYPEIWPTKSKFMSFLRGGIRRSLWNRSPIKIEFMKKNRIRIPNPSPKARVSEVWGAVCVDCKQQFALKDVEVDHVVGQHSLKDLSDLQPFIEAIVCVSEDDLSFRCKTCHRVKSYADRMGISLDEAVSQKEAIRLIKSKEDLTWLKDRGIVPAKTQKMRREQIFQHILKERGNEKNDH